MPGHRELGAGGDDRPRRGRDLDDPRRFRRGDAAQPLAARRRRAVRDARGAPPGPHRPRYRPGARHRSRSPRTRCGARRSRPRPTTSRSSSVSCSASSTAPSPRPTRTGTSTRCPVAGTGPRSGCSGRATTARSSPGCSGLPFSFAHHFASANTEPALAIYRAQLPAVGGARRAVRDARRERRVRAYRRRKRGGSRRRARSRSSACGPGARASTRRRRKRPSTRSRRPSGRSCGAGRARTSSGRPNAVRDELRELAARTGADELMLTTVVHGHAERRRSYELVADAMEAHAVATRVDGRCRSRRQGATCIMSVNPDGSCLPMLPCSKMPQPV